MSKLVLVTGGAGYIGSTIVRLLLERGYRVRVVDRLFFGSKSLEELLLNPDFELIQDDVRGVDESVMDGVHCIMDLAAVSNDPAGELDPEKTLDINWRGRNRMALLGKTHGVARYVLASSCSIYGFRKEVSDEESPINPLTTYAVANRRAEEGSLELSDSDYCVTALRQATVYGRSFRMRFDLAINGMTLGFHRNGKIPVLRDGEQWRPFIHVRDTARAFVETMEAPVEAVNGKIFNTGSEEQNVQILHLAQEVAEAIGVPFAMEWYGEPDHRSYRIDFSRILGDLGFQTEFRPADGAREIFEGLRDSSLGVTDNCFTVKWYKSLLDWHELIGKVQLNGRIL